jgi:hypothetical protein
MISSDTAADCTFRIAGPSPNTSLRYSAAPDAPEQPITEETVAAHSPVPLLAVVDGKAADGHA